MHRFFLAPELLAEAEGNPEHSLILPEKLAHQVRDVLHLEVGEQLVLLDNSGDEVSAEVTQSSRGRVLVRLLERQRGKRESAVQIILCPAVLKSARFEWILEKGTELGVTTFMPTFSYRSMRGLEDVSPTKLQRWRHIIQEATEQCGRSRLPELVPTCPLVHTLNVIPSGALALIPWEEETTYSLRSALQAAMGRWREGQEAVSATVMLFIGPEGGFTAEEVALAQSFNVQAVTLGPRIMRAETAALAAVVNVMYELEAAFQV